MLFLLKSSNLPHLLGINQNVWNVFASKSSLKYCAPLASAAKTPVQEWGWEYLQRQKQLKRPIAPHLSVYKPQLTWMVSGLHRISGTVMGGAVVVAAVTLMVAPFDFISVVEFIRGLGLPGPVTFAIRYIIAWPIIFHALNGARFLGFDLGKGMAIGDVYKSGWAVVFLSIFLALCVAYYRPDRD